MADLKDLFDFVMESLNSNITSTPTLNRAQEIIAQHFQLPIYNIFQGYTNVLYQGLVSSLLLYIILILYESIYRVYTCTHNIVCTQQPIKFKLGTKRIYHGHGRKRHLVEVPDTLVYVPLLRPLRCYLKMKQFTLKYVI